MRVALVSDIHGNLPALRAVAAAIEAARADVVLNLGDIASGPLWPRETVAWLAGRGWPTIAGNHERQALAAAPGPGSDDAFTAAELGAAERGWLAALPPTLRACDDEVLAFHGIPGNDLRGLLETVTPGYAPGTDPGVRPATDGEVDRRLAGTRAAVLVCGHTHTPRARRLADGALVVNPGSVGRPAYAHDRPHRHVVEAGTPHARWALLERRGDGWHAELQQTAYDWDIAARRAAALGFADWAHELVTGRTRPGCFS
ncbi:MAG: metallophosphoesterase family protein [Betaproteobacteria bacterium]